MAYYHPSNTISKGMLEHTVTIEYDGKIQKLTDLIMKKYDEYDEKDEGELDSNGEIAQMHHDKEMLEELLTNVKARKWSNMLETEQKVWIMKVIETGLFKPNHGDGFHWLGQGYRNEGLWFWDKEKGLIPPYTEIDDYGGVPPHFLVGNGEDQFSPDHWASVVDHNSYVFLAPDVLQEIKDTAKSTMVTCKYREKAFKVWHTSILIQNHVYGVKIELDDISNINNVFSFDRGMLYYN